MCSIPRSLKASDERVKTQSGEPDKASPKPEDGPTCNYRLPQTSVVLLYTEQNSGISGHEATWEYLGKR